MSDLTLARTAVVFGGAGFIGTHLMRSLVRSGKYVDIVSADLSPPAEKVPEVRYVDCDVRQPIIIEGKFDQPDIYNLAAVHTTPGHEDWEYFWTNVSGAAHICEFAARTKCRTMVFTSSISTYGPSEAPRDESGPFEPDSAYGRSKLQAEKIHRLWQQADPARRLVIVRPAVIFGRGERGNFTRLAALLKRGRFFYPGRTDTIKACGYVDELVSTIEFVRDLGQPEITYNFAYPKPYTIKDVCSAICDVAGFKMPKAVVPLWMMLCGGLFFEILAKLGLKTPVNRPRVLKLVNSTNVIPGKLLALGYEFKTDLKSGLKKWYSEEPKGEFL